MASRYDERGYVFLGTATAAALVIWLRSRITASQSDRSIRQGLIDYLIS